MALRFIKRLIHRKAIVFYYSVFRSALNATAPVMVLWRREAAVSL